MGILKNREEFLPVTCAILKEADRSAFFSKIRKLLGGKPEELARALGVPPSTVSDWMSGQANIPYHALQRIAHEFNVPVPPVTELRRESLPVSMVAAPPPPPTRLKRSSLTSKPRREDAPSRRAGRVPSPSGRSPRNSRNQGRPSSSAPETQKGPATEPPRAKSPQLSAVLAYWTGTVLARAKLQEGTIIFSADRSVGQNFAAIWARRTKELFGTAPRLSTRDEGKIQDATLSVEGLETFLKKSGFSVEGGVSQLPRWIWSNPEWKIACLQGLVDAGGRFQRDPSIILDLPAPLARAAAKICSSIGFKTQTGAGGAVTISGKEQIEKYFGTVGMNNLKLKDQIQSYLRHRAAHSFPPRTSRPPQPPETGAPSAGPPDSSDDPSLNPLGDQTSKLPPSLHPKPHPVRPKRTVFRGRPKR